MMTLIACLARSHAIGFHNRLLYHIPADMARFKQLTTGHTIVMGRLTYESLPARPLPGRRNIVISSTIRHLPGCKVYPSWKQFLDSTDNTGEVFVIGGASLYRQAIGMADRLCLTIVDDTPAEADAFFPPFDGWKVTKEERHSPDGGHPGYAFVDLA